MKLEARVARSIAKRKSIVVQRSELASFGSPAQLSRVLSALVRTGSLVRVSRGMYAKTRVNRFTGQLAPAATFEAIAAEIFRKLKIDVNHGKLAASTTKARQLRCPCFP
jgi:predicted transcriptional regulator of viral defense system